MSAFNSAMKISRRRHGCEGLTECLHTFAEYDSVSLLCYDGWMGGLVRGWLTSAVLLLSICLLELKPDQTKTQPLEGRRPGKFKSFVAVENMKELRSIV